LRGPKKKDYLLTWVDFSWYILDNGSGDKNNYFCHHSHYHMIGYQTAKVKHLALKKKAIFLFASKKYFYYLQLSQNRPTHHPLISAFQLIPHHRPIVQTFIIFNYYLSSLPGQLQNLLILDQTRQGKIR
jgi:hypothetical protein